MNTVQKSSKGYPCSTDPTDKNCPKAPGSGTPESKEVVFHIRPTKDDLKDGKHQEGQLQDNTTPDRSWVNAVQKSSQGYPCSTDPTDPICPKKPGSGTPESKKVVFDMRPTKDDLKDGKHQEG